MTSTSQSQESLIFDAMQSIADHYSQPIHLSTASSSINNKNEQEEQQVEVPYFDPLLGKPITSPSPVTHYWFERLIHITTISPKHVVGSLMKSYELILREKCFVDGSTGSSSSSSRGKTLQVQSNAGILLIQYEQLLSKYKEYLKGGCKNNGPDHVTAGQEERKGGQPEEEVEVEEDCIYTIVATTVERMASDIFSLSAMYIRPRDVTAKEVEDPSSSSSAAAAAVNSDDSLDQHTRSRIRNMILPVLLKLLQHMMDYLMYILTEMDCPMSSREKHKSPLRNDTQVKYCFAVGTLVALAFCKDCDFHHLQDCMDKKGACNMTMLTTSASSSDLTVWEIVDSKDLCITWKDLFLDQSTFAPTLIKDWEKSSYLDGLFQFAQWKRECHGEEEGSSPPPSSSSSSFMERTMVDFQQSNAAATIQSSWIDPTNGIGTRTARSLLQQISKSSLWLLLENDNDTKGNCHDNQHTTTTLIHGKCYQDIILKAVGTEYMCQLARELFFGRLVSSSSSTFSGKTAANKKSQQGKDSINNLFKSMSSHDLAFNGIIIRDKKASDDAANLNSQLTIVQSNRTKRLITRHIMEYTDSEPFKEVPALAVAAIRVMAALKFPNVTSNVLENTIPVAFTLIDSYAEYHQAFGAAILWNILTQVTPTCFVSFSKRDDDAGKRTYFENTQKVLSLACRTCKHSLSLCLLTMARFKLFEMAPSKEGNKLRRDGVSESYEWIQKSSFAGPGAESESLEVLFISLASCLQPLLHALAQLPEAGAMELGRAGLAVLLPLIRWDSNTLWGRKVQVASMECLLSLMMGAYPIMGRHGGKIMSELISCVGRLQRDVAIQNEVQNRSLHHDENDEPLAATKMTMVVALHVASAALVLCGQRAEDVLIKIETGSYNKSLVDACSVVRSSAAAMKK
jgi:hypothetical protein